MARRATSLPKCQICLRPRNDIHALTTMYRETGEFPAPQLVICVAKGCWDDANARGYYSQHQDRPAT